MAFISAHKPVDGRTDVTTAAAIRNSAWSSPDYIEFDVQRCADGVFVIHHDSEYMANGHKIRVDAVDSDTFLSELPGAITYAEALETVKELGARAHIDFKFTSPWRLYEDCESTHEVQAVKMALDVFGAEDVIITTMEDESVKAVREWSRVAVPELLVGLSLGRGREGRSYLAHALLRRTELFPSKRFDRCDANLVVANHKLAALTLHRFARRRGLPLLVWTVDNSTLLRWWTNRKNVFLVTSNYPFLAAAMHDTKKLTKE